MSEAIKKHGPIDHLLESSAHPSRSGTSDVLIQERLGVAQLQLIARNGKVSQLQKNLIEFLGHKEALAPMEGAERKGAFICATGPLEYWVFVYGRSVPRAADFLEQIVGDSACIFDQSEGRCILRFSGENALNVLAKGMPLDLHPTAFPSQGTAYTVIEHVPTLVARRVRSACWDISIPRSYAVSFVTWLMEAAREYGYVIEKPRSLRQD